MTLSRVVKLTLLVVALAPLALFYLQNMATRVDLVFRLPGESWYLARSASVPFLLIVAVSAGALVSALWFGSKALARGRAVRTLTRQVSVLEDDLALARLDRTSMADTGPEEATSPSSRKGPQEDGVADFDELI